MRISDWSSDVCSSDLNAGAARLGLGLAQAPRSRFEDDLASGALVEVLPEFAPPETPISVLYPNNRHLSQRVRVFVDRSEEHTSELQSLMRISYAVFCLKNKKQRKI